jgi:hypothetical protein
MNSSKPQLKRVSKAEEIGNAYNGYSLGRNTTFVLKMQRYIWVGWW